MKVYGKIGSKNTYYSWLLAASIYFTPLRSLLIVIGNTFLHGTGRYLSILSVLLFLGILVVPVLKSMTKTKDFLLWYCFVLFSWLSSWIFHIDYTKIWIGEAVDIFIHALPYYMIIQNITDWSEAKDIMYKSAWITVVIMLLYSIMELYTEQLFAQTKYTQFSGIITAGAAILCFIAFLDRKKIFYLFMASLAFGMIVLFGARMPIICFGTGVFLYFMEELRRKGRHFRILSKRNAWIGIWGIFLLIGYIAAIYNLRINSIESLGAGQRILWQISNGQFFKSDGRLQIYVASIESILEQPLCGYGIVADRIPIVQSVYNNEISFIGTYAHNLFLELWLQYGLVLGSVLIGIIILSCVLLLTKNMHYDQKIIAIYAIAMTFGILMFSGPVFSRREFWMMMGLGAMVMKCKKRR